MAKVRKGSVGVEGETGAPVVPAEFAAAVKRAIAMMSPEETKRAMDAIQAELDRREKLPMAAAARFTSSLTPTGYTPASALFASFRHSPLRALGVVESPVFREIRAAREARSIISPDLRRLREFRELKSTLELGRSLGMYRSAQRYEAPPAPPPAPPAPPPKDASTLRKERAAAAAAKRGEELRALAPAELLKRLRTLKSKGRALAKIAGDYGTTAAGLRALESAARQSVGARKSGKSSRPSYPQASRD